MGFCFILLVIILHDQLLFWGSYHPRFSQWEPLPSVPIYLWHVPIIFALSYQITFKYCESVLLLEFSLYLYIGLQWKNSDQHNVYCHSSLLLLCWVLSEHCIFSWSCLWKICRVLYQIGCWVKWLEHGWRVAHSVSVPSSQLESREKTVLLWNQNAFVSYVDEYITWLTVKAKGHHE